MKEFEIKVKHYDGGPLSAYQAMPTDMACDRAREHPIMGDQWTEHFSAWVHVDKVEDQRVLTRLYVGPCKIAPSEAREERWHESIEAFAEYVRSFHFNGNFRWVAEAGGHLGSSPLKSDKEQIL